ncbi:MAG: MFS transporter [Anaerolineaceae bacterium]|nr:MFS transporter [Anaerolineaceae bacterium]
MSALIKRLNREGQSLYYGWRIVAVLAITTTIAYGVLFYAFSVFIEPMEAELGWTRTTISGGFSLAMLVSGFGGVGVGWWLDRHGGRALMTLGPIAAVLLLFAWANVYDPTLYTLIWIGIGMTMATVFYEPAFTVVANWFTQRRGRALAIVTLVAGFASTIFLPLTNYLNEQLGWHMAIMVLAVLLGVVVIPLHALVLRRRPADMGLSVDGFDDVHDAHPDEKPKPPSVTVGDALRKRSFWVITLAFGAVSLAGMGWRVHLLPYLSERGYDPAFGAFMAGLIGAMQVLGRLIFAPLEAYFSTRVVTAGIFAMMFAAFVVMIAIPSEVGVFLFVVLFGASFGANTLARASLVADMFGVSHYGRISSMMALFLTFVVTVAPVGIGAMYTASGSYDTVVWLLPLSPIVGFFIIWLLPKGKASEL